ncbi:hypothetical protein CUJ83_09020 [Methanocella sp. CWC-04]|uniref:Uncharacterized protein n=1 Tax=Methanooceanicella nereidis TaxID=2052831 RepID=A0AAP2W6A4_9EURY|nr:hypothetical protein [Methanocella sp. CWC-04]MCD1295138.1 hypothetical protein [Methanocella sp. CWC-04]
MEYNVLLLYLLGFLGPLLIYLTRYVARGRTKDMTRLWFVTFFAFIIFYWLAGNDYIISNVEPIGYALLWPVVAILSFWAVFKLTEKEPSPIPFFDWMVSFLIAALFAFLLDGIAGAMGWYTYNPAMIDATAIMNPISGTKTPAVIPLMLGILLMGVHFLAMKFHTILKEKMKVSESSTTLLLSGLAVILGGLLWIVTEFVMGVAKEIFL